ncbi:MAG: RNA-binding S4 domain-containing protein [Hyphomicrobiaceae bacterium]
MARDEEDPEVAAGALSQRVDRWLWFARVVKSRTLAAGLVEAGRVRLNRDKIAKASQNVRTGDVLTLTVGPRLRILKVVALGKRRGPAPEARLLYEDLSPPPPPREEAPIAPAAVEREPGSGRPTKRDRRLTDRLKGD